MNIQKELKKLSEKKYQAFISNLTPSIPKERFLGIRIPKVKAFALKINEKDAIKFMNDLPHKYVEENIVHILLINKIKDIDECLKRLDELLPHLNSWVETDTGGGPKCFVKNKDKVHKHLQIWLKDRKHTYVQRYGVITLDRFFLDDDFSVKDLKLAYSVKNDDKYIKLMKSWYFATALAKHFDETYKFIKDEVKDPEILKMTVKKANESYRVTKAHKDKLNKLLNAKTKV